MNVVQKAQQTQMLRLVTQSFCKELLNYGVDRQDMVTISVELLDYVMGAESAPVRAIPPDVAAFAPGRIEQADGDVLRYGPVHLAPLYPELLPTVEGWLATTDVQRNFAVRYPAAGPALFQHFFEEPGTRYFGIFYQDTCVGLVGGEQIDEVARKVEMKKFIGEEGFRGLGIGKTATFLWLYHTFEVAGFNKVYIYSLDTNIRNINLNSALGFEVEGILFDDACLDGTYHDVVRMSLLRARWQEMFAG